MSDEVLLELENDFEENTYRMKIKIVNPNIIFNVMFYFTNSKNLFLFLQITCFFLVKNQNKIKMKYQYINLIKIIPFHTSFKNLVFLFLRQVPHIHVCIYRYICKLDYRLCLLLVKKHLHCQI